MDVPIVADAKIALEQMLEWIEKEWKEPKDTSDWMKQIANGIRRILWRCGGIRV